MTRFDNTAVAHMEALGARYSMKPSTEEGFTEHRAAWGEVQYVSEFRNDHHPEHAKASVMEGLFFKLFKAMLTAHDTPPA